MSETWASGGSLERSGAPSAKNEQDESDNGQDDEDRVQHVCRVPDTTRDQTSPANIPATLCAALFG